MMKKLPVEILSKIADELVNLVKETSNGTYRKPKRRLAKYATICFEFQLRIEAQTFQKIDVRKEDFAHIARIFSPAHRRRSIRKFHISFHQHNQEEFIFAIRSFGRMLAEWEDDDLTRNPTPLEVSIVNWVDSVLDEEALASIPEMPVVTIFNLATWDSEPMTACRLASRMTRMEELVVRFETSTPANPLEADTPFESRQKLAIALLELLNRQKSPNLKKLAFYQGGHEPMNHSFQMDSLLGEDGVDRLSDAIRIMSQTLSTVEVLLIDGMILSEDLFRNPRPRNMPPDTDAWPNLGQLLISASSIASNGNWLYTGDPELEMEQWVLYDDIVVQTPLEFVEIDFDPDDDEFPDGVEETDMNPHHRWRIIPDPFVFDPLLLEMVKAMSRMPQIQAAAFTTSLWHNSESAIQIQWAEAGYAFSDYFTYTPKNVHPPNIRRCEVQLDYSQDYEPSEEIIDLMREWVDDGVAEVVYI